MWSFSTIIFCVSMDIKIVYRSPFSCIYLCFLSCGSSATFLTIFSTFQWYKACNMVVPSMPILLLNGLPRLCSHFTCDPYSLYALGKLLKLNVTIGPLSLGACQKCVLSDYAIPYSNIRFFFCVSYMPKQQHTVQPFRA